MKKILLLSALLIQFNLSINAQLSCAGLISQTFNYTGGVQTWTVPAGISLITIKTTGGSGGVAPSVSNLAGGGAVIEASYNVTPGSTVTILVGGAGVNGNDFEAGGGGATAVYINGVLHIVAGGGGGEDNTGNGGNGLATNNGGSTSGDNASSCGCTSPNNGLGGSAGAGGNHGEFACSSCSHGGGGGGGLNSAGQGNGNNNAGGPGGQGSITGAAGGLGSADDAVGINGGWGWAGGGGADDRESGGGGGYSGGGGGPESFNPGGGGSYLRPGFISSYTANGTGTTTAINGSVTICYPNVLPLTLISFSGIPKDGYNLIKWKTADENNLLRFDIERSADGVIFSQAGMIQPVNNGAGNNYEYRDYGANGPKSFYRIRIQELDGTSRLSSIIRIDRSLTETITYYPNPVKDELRINSSVPIIKLEIINTAGAVLYVNKQVNIAEPISLKYFQPGVYLIKAYTAGRVIAKRFIKLP